jgi:hypothetical protein
MAITLHTAKERGKEAAKVDEVADRLQREFLLVSALSNKVSNSGT